MSLRRLLLASVLLPAAAVAQVEKTVDVPTRVSSPAYAPEARAPIVIDDETRAPKPLDLSAIFAKVDGSPIPVTPGELPLELKATAHELQFVDRLRKADATFQSGQYEAVIPELEQILAELPGDKGVRMLLSSAYQQCGRYESAEKLLKELISEFPGDYTLRNNLAWMYSTAQDPKFRKAGEAVKLARMALVIAPADHHVWSTLSSAYYADGEYNRALDAAQQAYFQVQKLGRQNELFTYSEQVEKCRKAVRTMSILE
ncbi:MAG: tetratricopeptide repeat protein [Kiritimatiellia bacterium]